MISKTDGLDKSGIVNVLQRKTENGDNNTNLLSLEIGLTTHFYLSGDPLKVNAQATELTDDTRRVILKMIAQGELDIVDNSAYLKQYVFTSAFINWWKEHHSVSVGLNK